MVSVGSTVGSVVGSTVGSTVGSFVSCTVGSFVDFIIGDSVGPTVGSNDGSTIGVKVVGTTSVESGVTFNEGETVLDTFVVKGVFVGVADIESVAGPCIGLIRGAEVGVEEGDCRVTDLMAF